MDLRTTSGKANSTTIPTRFIHCNSYEIQNCTNSNAGIGIRLFTTKVSRLLRVLRVSDYVILALQEYTPRLVRHYTVLAGIFASHAAAGTPIDATGFFLDLFFDVISNLTFGESFNTLTTKQRSQLTPMYELHVRLTLTSYIRLRSHCGAIPQTTESSGLHDSQHAHA
jgi:hypothetical protein